jgi:hypothetical protein
MAMILRAARRMWAIAGTAERKERFEHDARQALRDWLMV